MEKEDLLRSSGPIEPETIVSCTFCNNTGSVPNKTHLSPSNTVIVDSWQDCMACYHQRREIKAKLFDKVPVKEEEVNDTV